MDESVTLNTQSNQMATYVVDVLGVYGRWSFDDIGRRIYGMVCRCFFWIRYPVRYLTAHASEFLLTLGYDRIYHVLAVAKEHDTLA